MAASRATRFVAACLAAQSILCSAAQPGLAEDKPPAKQASSPKLGDQLTNSIGMKLAYIPAGEFEMGSPGTEVHREDNETFRKVRLPRPFYIGLYEVTVGEFGAYVKDTGARTDGEKDGKGGIGVVGDSFVRKPEINWRSPGFRQDEKHPVTVVSWNDAMAFCKWLSTKERATYRLPTEAEWEYTCRAGTKTPFAFGESLSSAQANFDGQRPYGGAPKGKSLVGTMPVGSYRPNRWGLFDMHGNVGELCLDAYEDTPDDAAPTDGKRRSRDTCVLRGGSWTMFGEHCRSAFRLKCDRTKDRACYHGFRVVRTVD